MLFYAVSVFSVAAFGLLATGEFTLPVTTCKRDSADYSACLKHALEEAWPRFVKGLPEYDFAPMDPIFYENAKLILNSDELHGELIASNITAFGLSKTRFFNVRTHYIDDAFHLELDILVPKLFIKGAGKYSGAVSVFRVAGKGHFNITAGDIRGTCNFIGLIVNDTLIIERVRFLPSIGNFKIYFDILVDQSKEINDIVVNFVNEFWPVLYRIAIQVLTDVWDPWLTNYSNKFFLKVPFSKIFP